MQNRLYLSLVLGILCLLPGLAVKADDSREISIDNPVVFSAPDDKSVTVTAGKYRVEDGSDDSISLVSADDGQTITISAVKIQLTPDAYTEGIRFQQNSPDNYVLISPISETEAFLAEAEAVDTTARAAITTRANIISSLGAPDGNPAQAIRVDNDGRVIVGNATAPNDHFYGDIDFAVRGAGNPYYDQASRRYVKPRFVAGFSNAGGSGSGVVIKAGYKHSQNYRKTEILRLASFSGPPEFVFFNNGTSSGLSDGRLKEDVYVVEGALDRLRDVRGVTFQWKGSDDRQIGLIAQDVERAFPELVTVTDGYKGVDYNRFPAVLVEAIKELDTELDALRADNLVLQEQVEQLQMQMTAQ